MAEEVVKVETVTTRVDFSSGEADVECTIVNGHIEELFVSCDGTEFKIEGGATALHNISSVIDVMLDYLMRHELL